MSPSVRSKDSSIGSKSSRERRISMKKPKIHAKGLTGKMFLKNERYELFLIEKENVSFV